MVTAPVTIGVTGVFFWMKKAILDIPLSDRSDVAATGVFPALRPSHYKICNTNIHGGKNDNNNNMPGLRHRDW